MMILLILTPFGTVRFWLTLVALLGLIAMQLVFWVVTQPVNRFWLQSEKLSAAGSAFFGVRETQSRGAAASAAANWTDYRDRWEYSHVARAVFAFVSLLALVIAVSRGG